MPKRPNPDDRSDNVEKLQKTIHDTIENVNESEENYSSLSTKEQEKIKMKNQRRQDAIDGFRHEIEDEL